MKRLAAGAAVLMIVFAGMVFLFARSILASDAVREALAAQASSAIGQPVRIASIDAGIFPRLTVQLGNVQIGEPARITVERLDVGTGLRALLSRRIEGGTLRLDGATIELPLPPFGGMAGGATGPLQGREGSAGAPIELVSIDEVTFRDVEIRSGGHTLRADIEAVPQGEGIALRRASLRADDTAIEAAGVITNPHGPVGELTLNADALDFDRLLALFSAFADDAGLSGGGGTAARGAPAKGRRPASGPAMDLTLTLEASRATLGAMALERLAGRARVTDGMFTVEPLTFALFGGRYEGTMALSLGDSPDLRLTATVAGVDVAQATAFAGSPNTITGTLSGRLNVTGRGLEAAALTKTSRGTVRVDIRDGIVRNLGLLRAVVLATSMRAESQQQMTGGSKDEPFSLVGATLRIGNGTASTDDLVFESPDLTMTAAGSIALDGSRVDLTGKLQLSEALSQQAGRDLQRYTQEQGRVTLPVSVTGSAGNLAARIDLADAAGRAIKNRATEEIQKGIKKGLGSFFK
jgi:uncharacterized protein involved in outer membrane biogenesis